MSLSEARESRSLIEAAEAAAAAGDWVSAARALREAAAHQEAELGSVHPDLANTLNNLAVASERAGDLDGAEAAFRRARDITHAAFGANHPDALTSARNLREFCAAHGKSDEIAGPPVEPRAESTGERPPESRRSMPTLLMLGAVGGLAAAGLLVWFVSVRSAGPSEPTPAPAAPEVARPALPKSVDTRSPSKPPAPAPVPAAAPSSPTITVVDATVCADFSTSSIEWRCTPIAGSTSVGSFVFYTRVRSPQPTTIEHRWYRGGTLHQRVSLRVAANTGAGYRTFSRNTIGADRLGTWRVELRDANGAVLHEATFAVQ